MAIINVIKYEGDNSTFVYKHKYHYLQETYEFLLPYYLISFFSW